MTWNRANPIFYLVLLFLIAEDLGSRFFADAKVIECSYAWKPAPAEDIIRDLCMVDNGRYPARRYLCYHCHRQDKKPPTADNCVDPNGRALSTQGSFDCTAGVDINRGSNKARPIICSHYDESGNPLQYRCEKRHVYQQCSECSEV
ncbi:uncharacterized protein MELLADRAFT_123937 [Melampsora larici-populina 98AG31]|uniref:Secreted protein n=1 Tax=Melampsora larici-populina (strain 98AG31 / pathotype 3-4-7) TaxID=747676 RepID=F4RND1_MELLP|nr:uncharacterized protein MELLADRAFT_123937 [Melampsora larici-populina 98AG31]EGG06119.1 secreted protein [Melampsora larici-populina 98AG31]